MSGHESFHKILWDMMTTVPREVAQGLRQLPNNITNAVGAAPPGSPVIPEALTQGYRYVVGVGAGAVRSVALACANLIPAIAKDPDLKKTIDETSQWLVMTTLAGLHAKTA
jgi:hypothetical protein